MKTTLLNENLPPAAPTRAAATDLPLVWIVGGLCLLCFALFFYKLGSYPLMDIDEPRYAEAAREMVESGNWITPHFNYAVRLEKPILFYWLAAGSYLMFGVSEFAARFTSAVTALSLVLSTFFFARLAVSNQVPNQVSDRFGVFAALILATAIEVTGLSRMAVTDMTLACFMGLTGYALFLAAVKSPKCWLLAGAFSGLAVLTKGPVGIVLPGAILVLYALCVGSFKKTFLNRWFVAALILCAAIALPWYVVAYAQNGPEFLNSLFFNNVTRFNDVVTGHSQAGFQVGPVNIFFAVVLLVGFMPWTLYLLIAAGYWIGQWRKHGHGELLKNNRLYPVALYGAIWAVFMLVFFSVSKTKLLTYILPLFPGLALVTASVFDAACAQAAKSGLTRALAVAGWLMCAVLMVAGAGFWVLGGVIANKIPAAFSPLLQNPANVFTAMVLVCGLGCVALLLSRRSVAGALVSQACVMAFMTVIAMHHVMPDLSDALQGDVLRYAKMADGKPLAVYEIQRPSLTFYVRHEVPHVKHNEYETFYAMLAKNPMLYVITKNSYLEELGRVDPKKATVVLVENGPVYSLLAVRQTPAPSQSKGQ